MEEQEYITEPTWQLPPQLSTFAPEIDWVYDFIFWVSVVSFFAIIGAQVWFMFRYRRRPGVKAEPTGHSNVIELAWTFGPVPLLVLMFHWGFQAYMAEAIAPDDSINIRVRARQWAWQFEHYNGTAEDNEVHIPMGRPVRFIISSEDVLHSFFVPEFRIKRDAVPGMFSAIWVEAVPTPYHLDAHGERVEMGESERAEWDAAPVDRTRQWYHAQIFCTEYCGAGGSWDDYGGHARMLATVIVQRQQDWQAWVNDPPPPMDENGEPLTPVAWGEQLFAAKGCTACHQRVAGGPQLAGPSFWGLAGRQEQIQGEGAITADEAYIRHSILEPQAQIVEGFPPVMPSIRMSEQQLDALVAYIQTLHD